MADVTLSPGANIQTSGVNAVNSGDTVYLNDGIYQEQAITIPAGKTVRIRPVNTGVRWWATDPTKGAGNFSGTGVLVSGGKVLTDWAVDGSYWSTSLSIDLREHTNSGERYIGIGDRDGHIVTCTMDGDWLHHVDDSGSESLGDTPRTGAAGNYYIDYVNNKIHVSIDPTIQGRTVIVSTQNAVITGTGTGIIEDLTLGHSRQPTQQGLVKVLGPNWDFNRVEVFASHGSGVHFRHNNGTFRNGYIHHTGQILFTCSNEGSYNNDGSTNNVGNTLENSLLEYGNMNYYKPGHEAGATKVAWTDQFSFIHNHVRKTYGFGLWADINCYNPIWRYNLVEDVWGPGLMQEIGFKYSMRHNKIVRAGRWPNSTIGATFPQQPEGGAGWNTHAGIMNAESNAGQDRFSSAGGGPGGVGEVQYNWVEDCRGGIFLRQINRDGDGSFPGGDAYHNKNHQITNNRIWWDSSAFSPDPKNGAGDSHPSYDMFAGTDDNGNYFDRNDYTIDGTQTTPTDGWEWDGALNSTTWTSTAGQDANSIAWVDSPEGYGLTDANPFGGGTGGGDPGTDPTNETDGFYLWDGADANYFSAPDSANLSPTGTIDFQALIRPKEWFGADYYVILGKSDFTSATDKSYRFGLSPYAGTRLRAEASDDGDWPVSSAGDDPLTAWVDDETKVWVRVVLRSTAGTGETYYHADTGGVDTWPTEANWTSLGTTYLGATLGSVYDGSSALEVGRSGDNAFWGRIYAVRMYDGEEGSGGTKRVDLDFRDTTQRTGTDPDVWTDAHSNVFTEQGSLTYVEGSTNLEAVGAADSASTADATPYAGSFHEATGEADNASDAVADVGGAGGGAFSSAYSTAYTISSGTYLQGGGTSDAASTGLGTPNIIGGQPAPSTLLPIVELSFTDPLDTPVWVDVTDDLHAGFIQRGRSDELSSIEAGTATLRLDNSSRDYDPTYVSGPYYPFTPMTSIRIRARYNGVDYNLFRGYVEAWPMSWPTQAGAQTITTIEAVDGFRLLSAHETSTALGSTKTGSRVYDVLNNSDWPVVGMTNLEGGVRYVQAHTPICQSVLQIAHEAARAERGLFFMDTQGRAAFQSASHRSGSTPVATYGDAGGSELPYEGMEIGYDDRDVYNELITNRKDGPTQVVQDDTSIDSYGKRSLKVFDLHSVSDADAADLGSEMLAEYKDAKIRCHRITVNPANNDTLWQRVLTDDLSTNLTIKRTPPGGGSALSFDAYIEGIRHEFNPSRWITTYDLSQREV